jgi:hypothetical protein
LVRRGVRRHDIYESGFPQVLKAIKSAFAPIYLVAKPRCFLHKGYVDASFNGESNHYGKSMV